MTDTAGVDEINAAVTFADLAGFTALTEAHGDIVAADIAERFVAVAESIMGTGDRLVKATPAADAIAATFLAETTSRCRPPSAPNRTELTVYS